MTSACQVSNPTAEEVTFDVVLAGPGLLGEPAVTLGPGQSCSYEAVFSPLVPGSAQGCVCLLAPSLQTCGARPARAAGILNGVVDAKGMQSIWASVLA